ncbi:MAG: M6 family metalloprotease domain-containing protein [Bacteroidaceae bacterium]|nr:M6 family metalloprotease domain-containing protein [Bacteroidaceae bacterium]
MRKILLSIIALCISGATFASRPLKGFRTHVQSDGKTINIQPTGNSISGFYVTNDDFALYSVDGDFFYAYLDAEGNFKNSGILAHNKEERTEAENELLKGSEYQNVSSRFEYEPETYRLPQSKATRGIGSTDLATIKCTGSPKVLVVLVDFSDVQFCTEEVCGLNPYTYYNTMLNFTDPAGNADSTYFKKTYNTGSVQQYFIDQSGGKFKPVFDVYSKIYRANNPATYYGKNYGDTPDKYLITLRSEVAAFLKNEGVDLSQYDADKDGVVDCLLTYLAGPSETTGGSSDYLKNKCVSGNSYSTCGVYKINTTIFANEMYYDSNKRKIIEGIGTTCHEFSHALGLPDFYYCDKTIYFGLDYWSVMDYGLYGANSSKIPGSFPVGYTAYEKEFMGWTTIEELTEGYREFKNLKSVAAGGKAYRVTNPANTNEYLILESRQNDNWYLLRSGLQIMKVKYDYDKWTKNRVNSYADQLCTLIPADGELTIPKSNSTEDEDAYYKISLIGDLFPIEESLANKYKQLSTVTEFVPTDESLFYYKFPIRNITRDKTAMTVSFTIGNNPTGVDAANAAALVDVYDVSGIRLRKDVEAGTATDNLPEGIYIVGGKKVIKR